jgi:hypothetical protein
MLKLSFAYFFLSHYSAVDFFEIDNNDKFFQRLSRIKLGLSDIRISIHLSPIIDLNFKPISASITQLYTLIEQ